MNKPLELCPNCNKQLVYLKAYTKKDSTDYEAICLDGHKTTFTILNSSIPKWKDIIRKRFSLCVICGGLARPDYETLEKNFEKTRYKIKCEKGCNDNFWREWIRELPTHCYRCGAPLTKENIEDLKQGWISCSNCGISGIISF